MARIHRPPPPVPTAEHDDPEENYGVWAENEFDDGEVYENYETEEGDKEDNSDYEEPEDATNTATAQEAACPEQPPVPPRQGARQTPFPTPLPVPIPAGPGRRVSPRVSPIPMDRRKFVPQPPVTVKDEDDEMYEAVDSPHSPVDDGEVYSEVDNEPLLQKPTAVTEKRALPPFPKAGIVRPPVPNPPNVLQLPDAKSSKSSLSPKLGRREVPAPPAVVKPTPSSNRLLPVKPMPQPTLPPPSPGLIRNEEEEEAEEMYEEGDFYLEKESTQAFAAAKSSKPLPKPPQGEELDDEYYTEVPELSKPAGSYSKADRPIPPIPQQQSSSLQPSAFSQSVTGSTRIPVEKLQAGLARLAEAKAIAAAGDQDNTAKSAEDSIVGSFSGLALANAKKLLKPVSRGESLNSAEKPVTVSVKRADSDNVRVAKAGFEKKGSLLSEMKNKLDSKQADFGKVNARTPATHYEDAEPVRKSPTPNRQPVQNVGADSRPPPSSVLANSSRRPLVQTTEANDRLLPPKIPPSRNSSDNLLPRQVQPSAEGQESLCSFGWFFNTIERQSAEKKVLEINQDGAFLVRKSQRGGDCNPYTLTLLYSGHVYNLHTRKRKDGKFALGTEKPDEHVFNSVEDLINFHRNNPIEVVGDARKNMGPGKVILRSSPKK